MKKVKFATDFRGFFPAKKSVRHVRHVRHAVEAAELAVRSSPVSGLRPGHLPTDRRESQSLEESMQCMAFSLDSNDWTLYDSADYASLIDYKKQLCCLCCRWSLRMAGSGEEGWRPRTQDQVKSIFKLQATQGTLLGQRDWRVWQHAACTCIIWLSVFIIFNFETLNFRSELHSPENYFPHQNDDVTRNKSQLFFWYLRSQSVLYNFVSMPQLLLPNPKGASIIAVTGADGGLGAHAPGAEVRVQQFLLRAVARICLKQVQFLNTVITWTWTSLAQCRFRL